MGEPASGLQPCPVPCWTSRPSRPSQLFQVTSSMLGLSPKRLRRVTELCRRQQEAVPTRPGSRVASESIALSWPSPGEGMFGSCRLKGRIDATWAGPTLTPLRVGQTLRLTGSIRSAGSARPPRVPWQQCAGRGLGGRASRRPINPASGRACRKPSRPSSRPCTRPRGTVGRPLPPRPP